MITMMNAGMAGRPILYSENNADLYVYTKAKQGQQQRLLDEKPWLLARV